MENYEAGKEYEIERPDCISIKVEPNVAKKWPSSMKIGPMPKKGEEDNRSGRIYLSLSKEHKPLSKIYTIKTDGKEIKVPYITFAYTSAQVVSYYK